MQLLMDQPLNKITVKEVAQQADLERKTFCLHFDSLDEVVATIEQDLQDELITQLQRVPHLDAATLVQILNQLMLKHQHFYQKVLNTSPNLFLNDDFQLILQRCLEQLFLSPKAVTEQRHYLASFLAAGIVACYREYLQTATTDLATVNAVILQLLTASQK